MVHLLDEAEMKLGGATTFTAMVPEVHFHAESTGASPVIISHKMAKLFKFLQPHSQLQMHCRSHNNTSSQQGHSSVHRIGW